MNLYAYYLMAYGVCASQTEAPNVPGMRPPLYAMGMMEETVLAVTMGVTDALRSLPLKPRSEFLREFKMLFEEAEHAPEAVDVEGEDALLSLRLNPRTSTYVLKILGERGSLEYEVHGSHVMNLIKYARLSD